MGLTRRQLLKAGGVTAGAMILPTPAASARTPAARQQFLFGVNALAAPVVEDVYGRGGVHADTNFGDDEMLLWKTSSGDANLRRETFLTFDVDDIDADVDRATLWLYGRVSGGVDGDYPDAVPNFVYEVPDPDWTTGGLTWNTRPATASTSATSFVVGGPRAQDDRWHGIDLTELVATAVDQGRSRIGIAIKREQATGPMVSIHSTRSSTPPWLEINGPPPPAPQQDLQPAHDGYVRGGIHADANFGDDEALLWKTSDSNANLRRETFLTFDIDELGGAVEQATLWLYGRVSGGVDGDYPDAVANFVYEVPDPDWTTGGLTWNTRPATAAAPASSFVVGGFSGQDHRWHRVDITDLVAMAVDQGHSRLGIAIRRDQSTGPIVAVHSSRSSTPPRLEINGPAPVRSALYPEDWEPGYTDAQGRFLHDFSYAGYGLGQDPPTQVPGPTVDVTDAPYGADPSGAIDSTAAIQAAIDDVGAGGGGTVYLPAGTYRVAPQADSRGVLHVPYHDLLIRGDGPGETFVLNADDDMRQRSVILIAPDAEDLQGWHDDEPATAVAITGDVTTPTTTLPVESPGAFEVGDWVVLRTDTTQAWLDEHPVQPEQEWTPTTFGGLVYHRQITAVDPGAGTVAIDIPTRYKMLTRDNLRLYHYRSPVVGSGVADLSIGMLQSDLSGTGENDYQFPGTLGHSVHGSYAITFNNAVDGWVRNVHSYRPPENADDFHLLSGGVHVNDARSITIVGADMRNSQYRGGGGNGYLFHLTGSDSLIRNAYAEAGRHNYLIQTIQSTGNVILDSHTKDGDKASEFHRQLSAANLFDNVSVENDTLSAYYRAVLAHAHSTTESVFWNSSGENCRLGRLIRTQQFGWGYVIGTSGTGDCAIVEAPGGTLTEPVDYVEHQGLGAYLEPRSLYLDQLKRRLT